MKNLIFANTNITLNNAQYVTLVQGTSVVYSGTVASLVTTTYTDTVAVVASTSDGVVIVLQ